MLMKWIRSRAGKQEEELPQGHHCVGCRTSIAGKTEDELRASGGVFLAGAGWFCGRRCERQYRLRFRIQTTPADGTRAARTPTPRPPPLVADPVPPEESPSPARRSAADELADALRAKRRQPNNGV